jgi:hypothetical protein
VTEQATLYAGLAVPLFEARPDWLTAFGRRSSKMDDVLDYGMAMVQQEERFGGKRERWGLKGFTGFRAGAFAFGLGKYGAVVVASGPETEVAMQTLSRKADHWSRVDYCVTAYDQSLTLNPPIDYWHLAADLPKFAQGDLILDRVQRFKRGSTITIGSRTSARFGRCYDKYHESPDCYVKGCWRWELELKREAAEAEQEKWRVKLRDGAYAHNIVSTFFTRLGLPVPWTDFAVIERNPPIKRERDIDRTMRWFEQQVKPSVEWAAMIVGKERVLRTLGL